MVAVRKKIRDMRVVGIVFVIILFSYAVLTSNGQTIMGGEIPLMDGADIEKESIYEGSGQFEMVVEASSEEVARFYNQAMEQKGWPSGMVVSAGNKNMLMLENHGDQFFLTAESKNGRTHVIIALIRKSQSQTVNNQVPATDTTPQVDSDSISQDETIPGNSDTTITNAPPAKDSHLPAEDSKVQHADFPINTPVSSHPLKMFFPTVSSDGFLESDQLLIIRFSQPLDPAFFNVEIDSGIGKWTVRWSPDFRQIILVPDSPLESGKTIQVKAEVLGGPMTEQAIKIRRLSPGKQLTHDLKTGQIDINQVARYRVFSLFRPSLAPEIYRLNSAGRSGTPTLKQVQKDLEQLDEETRWELQPYLLSPLNPDSFWHKKLQGSEEFSQNDSAFSVIMSAWAEEQPGLVEEVYTTENGYHLVIIGLQSEAAKVHLAHHLIKSEKIYERFRELLGVDVPAASTNNIYIFIFNNLVEPEVDETATEEEKIQAEEEAKQNESCGYVFNDEITDEPIIFISANQCQQENVLGGTLAHELFHVFQASFAEYSETWLEESTAVWSENYINSTWNTEQEYMEDAFEYEMARTERLDTDSDSGVYGVYLFPYYLTNVNPKTDSVIRLIWENRRDGYSEIDAVQNAIGNFDDVWKDYSLVTLDVEPEDGKIPDTIGRFGGEDPLILLPIHGMQKLSLDNQGIAGGIVNLKGIQAAYFEVTNTNQGADAPAVRFDLIPFQKYPGKLSIQAIVHYRDGRKAYEDWTGLEERLFCLNIDSQNFSEVYIVISCSDSKMILSEILAITPEHTSRCYGGTVTLTRSIEERESLESTFRIDVQTTETQSRNAAGKRSVTLRLELDLSERILPQQEAALDQMQEMMKDVKADQVEAIRGFMESIIKTPQAKLDSETGLMKVRYRVKNCSINSAGGHYNSKSQGERTDSGGMSNEWEINYTKQWSSMGLNEETLRNIERGHIRADIYYEPETGKILWVHIPTLEVDMNVNENSTGHYTRRTSQGYETNSTSSSDSKEDIFQVTHRGSDTAPEGLPLNPVWQAKKSTDLTASGGIRNESHISTSTLQGILVDSFEWSINLDKKNL